MLPIQTWGASSATHGPSLGAQGGTRCWSSGAVGFRRLWILFDEFLFRFLAGVGWLDLRIITVYWSPVKSILSSCTCYRKDLQSWMSSSFARWGELLMFWHFCPSEDIEQPQFFSGELWTSQMSSWSWRERGSQMACRRCSFPLVPKIPFLP